MMRYFITLICFFLCNVTFGQIVIGGMVKSESAGEPIDAANVMIQKIGEQGILAYTMTNAKGEFTLKTDVKVDSLTIVVSGVGVELYKRPIKAISQTLTIGVKEAKLNVREVIVKADPIRRSGDTLNYSVAQFMDQSDRSIGDVLKKMPGIEVAPSGQIKYYGKAINKFYIENMDMLEGRYGIATTNVSAKDIATVQVLENHQPINVIRKIVQSDHAAINLKLKEDVKGTWNGNIQAGIGYKPAMWNGEAVAMMFARKLQTLNTYKGNNEGNNVGKELKSLYGEMGDAGSMIGIYKPYTPQIEQQRYVENRINTFSGNMLVKLAKDYQLTLNATYLNDRQIFNGNSRTSYYLPDKVLDIDESTFARYKINQATLDLNLTANTDEFYLKNTLKAAGQWNVDDGEVVTDNKNINQWHYRPKVDLSNQFNLIKNTGKAMIYVASLNEFTTSPASLNVTPLLYPELIEPGNFTNLEQNLQLTNFHSNTSAEMSFTKGHFTHGYRVGVDADLQWLNSSLAPAGAALPDSLANNQYGYKLKYYVTPNFSYKKNNQYAFSLLIPVAYQNLIINDYTRNNKSTKNTLLINPSFNFSLTVTPSFKISASASMNRNVGSLLDNYSGYIMNDYRSISNREGIISDNIYQRYFITLNYGNAIYSLFGTLEGGYWNNNSNLMYDTKFIGTLSQIKSYAIDNISQGYMLNAKASKRVGAINTTFEVKSSYNKSYRYLLRQSEILNTTNDILSIGGSFTTLFGKISRLDYEIEWSKSFTKVFGKDESYAPIETITQKAALMFFPTKMLTIKLLGERFYNNAITDGSRSMFFVDASVSYKTKRFEYMIEGRNLLNTKEFYNATYGDAMGYRYIYALRPASVMVKVKFYIK